jgi:hypothetical protein
MPSSVMFLILERGFFHPGDGDICLQLHKSDLLVNRLSSHVSCNDHGHKNEMINIKFSV